MKWIVLPYSESYFEETKYTLVNPVIKNNIKRIAFENAYESFIIFQPLLYANVPAESPSYAPTFFKEMYLLAFLDVDCDAYVHADSTQLVSKTTKRFI